MLLRPEFDRRRLLILSLATVLLASTAVSAGHYILPSDQRSAIDDTFEFRVRWVRNSDDPEIAEEDFFNSVYDESGYDPPGSENFLYTYGGGTLYPAGGNQLLLFYGHIEMRQGGSGPWDEVGQLTPTWVP